MIYLLTIVFILSLVLTWYLRHYALAKNIMDIPNHRSSHTLPTPRGGGVSFVIALLVSLPLLSYLKVIDLSIVAGIMGAGLTVAILGFLDDKIHLSAATRLIGHLGACCFALYSLGGMPAITLFSYTIPAGIFLNIVTVFYLTWLLNLYNFMDGIDGLAATEAVSVCLCSTFLYWLGSEYTLMALPLILAAAVGGFLWWNFPPARIFMGDAGSGFLGLILGILSIQAAATNLQFFWCWLILLGVFIVDATVTLLFRLFQGFKIYEAHCDHAYQHAARLKGSHFSITMRILMINIFWLFPIAIMVNRSYIHGLWALTIAYFPLIVLTVKLNAGKTQVLPNK